MLWVLKRTVSMRHGIGEKRWLFSIGNGAEIRPQEKGRKSPGLCVVFLSKTLYPVLSTGTTHEMS